MVQTRRIILAGIRGWENKKDRARREQRGVHRTSKESMKGRIMKKATGKNSWFRKKKKKLEENKKNVKNNPNQNHSQTGENKEEYTEPPRRV